jgi:hypothetical protein
MHQTAEFAASSTPVAVAFSPDGTHIVGGLDGTNDLVNLYARPATAPVWQRFGATASQRTWTTGSQDQVLSGSLTFSTDGSHVYGLVSQLGVADMLLFASRISTSTTNLHLTIKSSNVSHPVTASVTVASGGTVAFTTKSNGATRRLGSVVANSKGVATVKFASSCDGSVDAVFDGSTTHYPATAKKSFKVASKTSVAFSGSYATRHGLKLFRGRGKVHVLGTVAPAIGGRRVTGAVEFQRQGKWHSLGSLVAHLNKKGIVTFELPFSAPHLPERVTMTFRGDKLNLGSRAVSSKFEIT